MTGPFRFCPSCGTAGGHWRADQEYRCPVCQFRYYQSVAAACGVVLTHGDRFLFLVRAKAPGQGLLGLPGGFIDAGESVEQAVTREVAEEIGGKIGPLTFVTSFPNHYPFAGVTYRTCDLYFRAELLTPPNDLRADPDEVTELRWLTADQVNSDDLAFESLKALWSSLRPGSVSR